MSSIKVWPHMTIVAVICALVAGLGVAFWMKNERTALAESLPNAARIQRVDGEVAISNGLYDNGNNTQWVSATPNTPFSVGDRIYTRDNSRASLAFTGRNFARLYAGRSGLCADRQCFRRRWRRHTLFSARQRRRPHHRGHFYGYDYGH